MPQNYRFLDHYGLTPYYGKTQVHRRMISRNSGGHFEMEEQHIHFAAHFFLADDMVKHSRSVYTFLQVLSEFGGIIEIFLLIFVYICTNFNGQ